MSLLVRLLRERLVPAVLAAAGVTLIAAGLMSYTGAAPGTDPSPPSSETPEIVSADPGASLGASLGPGLVLPSLPPVDASPPASSGPSASAAANRVATRVVIEALDIDLPVIKPKGNSSTYPQCNVALYIQELSQPGQGRATYLYAHARDGMFGPIYERAILKKSGGPKSMIGLPVAVYTSDDQLFLYEVVEVRLHQLNLDAAIDATSEELWLQTSEGPRGTPGKTQLLARFVASASADHRSAHPTPHPVTCD